MIAAVTALEHLGCVGGAQDDRGVERVEAECRRHLVRGGTVRLCRQLGEEAEAQTEFESPHGCGP